jgi:hypothetical protein
LGSSLSATTNKVATIFFSWEHVRVKDVPPSRTFLRGEALVTAMAVASTKNSAWQDIIEDQRQKYDSSTKNICNLTIIGATYQYSTESLMFVLCHLATLLKVICMPLSQSNANFTIVRTWYELWAYKLQPL